jgi:hypothetical protein
VRTLVLLAVVAVSLASCTSDADPEASSATTSTTLATTDDSPITARIELPTTTLGRGETITALVVVTNTGNNVRFFGCGTPFQIRLSSEAIEPELSWHSCSEDFILSTGETTFEVPVPAVYNGCDNDPRSDCTINDGLLPAGDYEARLYQNPSVVPDPEPIAVRVVD